MSLKKNIIVPSILTFLSITGCNGNSPSEESDTNVEKSTKTIKVIGEHTSDILICIDKNNNNKCDEGESIGYTNIQGEFFLDKNDVGFPIIANVIAGKTANGSSPSNIALRSYSMVSSEGQSVITPFTTLAKNKKITIDTLASELNLDKNAISGDYTSAPVSNADGIKAQYIARSLASVIDIKAASKKIEAVINEAQKRIANHANNGTLEELNHHTLIIKENGTIESQTQTQELEPLLLDKKQWYRASFNKAWLKDEGISKVIFNDGKMHWFNNDGSFDSIDYHIEDNRIESMPDREGDDVIFTSENLLLSITDEVQDLAFWTSNELGDAFKPQDLISALFSNKKWYYLVDDSTAKSPAPMLAEFSFSHADKQTVTIKLGDELLEARWSITKITNSEFGIYHALNIEFPPSEGDSMSLMLTSTTKNSGMLLVSDTDSSSESFSLLIDNKVQAQAILEEWKSRLQDGSGSGENKKCKGAVSWSEPLTVTQKLEGNGYRIVNFSDDGSFNENEVRFEFTVSPPSEQIAWLNNKDIYTYDGIPQPGFFYISYSASWNNMKTTAPVTLYVEVNTPDGDTHMVTEKIDINSSSGAVAKLMSLEAYACKNNTYRFEFKQ